MKIDTNALAEELLKLFERTEEYVDGTYIDNVCLDGWWNFKQLAMDLAEVKERWTKNEN